MHGSSIFNIRIDFEKSHDSYIYDKNTNSEYLDCFGFYSALPLGYSHSIFQSEDFRSDLLRVGKIKVTNCEIISDEGEEFVRRFSSYKPMSRYTYFHFCCTGALAIEAAIKTAIDYKASKKPMILSLKQSFHGINSYGCFLTDRTGSSQKRLEGMPDMGWVKLYNPKVIYSDGKIDHEETERGFEQFKRELDEALNVYKQDIAALLVEPIQATAGDNYFSDSFFSYIRDVCAKNDICLIFDEVQTGFGTTGDWWYYVCKNIEPDIVVFGKKVQCSGVMVKEKFGRNIFSKPIRLEVTWDGDLVDMLRATYIMKAYEQFNIFDNVNQRGMQFFAGLKQINTLKNVRQQGLFIAFDMDSREERNVFVQKLFDRRLLCNRTHDKTVRLRPNLNISEDEVNQALSIINICSDVK